MTVQVGVHKHSSRESDVIATLGSDKCTQPGVGGQARESSRGDRSSTESESEYKRLKICKRGYREALVTRVCGVAFQGLPVWLWAIRLGEWSEIFISDTDEVNLRQYHASTWEQVNSKLIIVSEGALIPTIEVWMVSGPLDFVLSFMKGRLGSSMVGWISDGARRRPTTITNPQWTWTNVSHIRIGGVTKATGLFCSIGFDKIVVPDDPIRRTIGHILKYSERPRPCSLPVSEPHYVLSDRLSLHRLDLPVVFPSGFSRTGWGLRKLTHAELEHAFDLPNHVLWEAVKDSKLLPLQLFRVDRKSTRLNSSHVD